MINVSSPRQCVNFPIFSVKMPLQLWMQVKLPQEQRNSVGLVVSSVTEDGFMYCDLFAKLDASSKGSFFVVFFPWYLVFRGQCRMGKRSVELFLHSFTLMISLVAQELWAGYCLLLEIGSVTNQLLCFTGLFSVFHYFSISVKKNKKSDWNL